MTRPGPRVALLRPRDLADAQLAAWRSFQDRDPALASPFLTPEFVRIAAEIRPQVVVAAFEVDGRIAGFLPFERRGRVARPVVGGLSDCQAVIAAPWWQWEPKALVAAAGLSAYDFTNQRACQAAFAPYALETCASHAIDLTRGFDAYVRECRENAKGESAKERPGASSGLPHQTMARLRRLERRSGPVRFVMHETDPAALHRLIGWKSRQYRRTGLPDVFARPWTVALLERIHATRTAGFAGVLSTLVVGDEVVAAHMGMRSASVLHWWFPGYDAAASKSSPGLILLLELTRQAAAAGLRTIELGSGDEAYKLLVANAVLPVVSGFVGPPSLATAHRRFQHASAAWAERLPIGPAARWPGRLFRRIELLRRYR